MRLKSSSLGIFDLLLVGVGFGFSWGSSSVRDLDVSLIGYCLRGWRLKCLYYRVECKGEVCCRWLRRCLVGHSYEHSVENWTQCVGQFERQDLKVCRCQLPWCVCVCAAVFLRWTLWSMVCGAWALSFSFCILQHQYHEKSSVALLLLVKLMLLFFLLLLLFFFSHQATFIVQFGVQHYFVITG